MAAIPLDLAASCSSTVKPAVLVPASRRSALLESPPPLHLWPRFCRSLFSSVSVAAYSSSSPPALSQRTPLLLPTPLVALRSAQQLLAFLWFFFFFSPPEDVDLLPPSPPFAPRGASSHLSCPPQRSWNRPTDRREPKRILQQRQQWYAISASETKENPMHRPSRPPEEAMYEMRDIFSSFLKRLV